MLERDRRSATLAGLYLADVGRRVVGLGKSGLRKTPLKPKLSDPRSELS